MFKKRVEYMHPCSVVGGSYLGLATLGLERVHGQHREPEAGLQWQRRELAQVFGLVVADLK